MKFTATATICFASTASAFVIPSSLNQMNTPLSMVDERTGFVDVPIKPVNGFGNKETSMQAQKLDPPTPPPSGPRKSEALPFMTVPAFMDGSMPGDVGFDPLGFADTPASLTKYREAEIKHARLAMLAAAGWPISELFDRKIAAVFGMDAVLDAGNRVPSVLNGGMGKISPAYWAACIVLAGAVDVVGSFSESKKKNYFPGNFNFDPLNLYPQDEKGRLWMQTAEIKNGRLAMLAITGFCFQELVTHIAVVDQTSFFFKPIWETLGANVPAYTYPDTDVVQDVVKTTVESVSTPAMEATTILPPVESITPPAVESITSAATSIAPPVVQSIPAVTPPVITPPVESVVAASVETKAAVTVPVEELETANKRIADLESKLNEIRNLSR